MAAVGIGRTRALQLLTLHHAWVLAGERALGRSAALRRLSAPASRWLARGSTRVCSGPAQGLRLSLAALPANHVQAGAMCRAGPEPQVQEALRRHLGPGGVLWDLGANVGFFALLAARVAGPRGHVYALEPDPRCAASIRTSAELNGFRNVTVIEKAAGARTRREPFALAPENTWSHLVERGQPAAGLEVLTVEAAALDELAVQDDMRAPTVIKLDVEGSEIDALNGMRRTLERDRPVLICELHETVREFQQLASSHGYRVTNLMGPEALELTASNPHALAIPAT